MIGIFPVKPGNFDYPDNKRYYFPIEFCQIHHLQQA